MFPTYGDPYAGFSATPDTGIKKNLDRSDKNRREEISRVRAQMPAGAMLQGNNFVVRENGKFKIVGSLDEQALEAGLPQPGQRQTSTQPQRTVRNHSHESLRKDMRAALAKYNQTPAQEPPTPTRDQPPVTDPYNTDAKGTITGLSGGSIAAPYSDEAFVGMLGEKYGIQLTNPFSGAPNPATPGHQAQIRLTSGEIDPNAPVNLNTPANKPGIDDNPAADQTQVSGLEALRTLSPDDVYIPEGELSEKEKGMATSRRSARSRAFLDYDGPGGSMAALRAAEASQGYFYDRGQYKMTNEEGGFDTVTREGIQQYKEEEIGAQDLLSKHLAQAPEKALEKAFEMGNADVIGGDYANTDYTSQFEGDSAADNFPIPAEDTEMFGGTIARYQERLKK